MQDSYLLRTYWLLGIKNMHGLAYNLRPVALGWAARQPRPRLKLPYLVLTACTAIAAALIVHSCGLEATDGLTWPVQAPQQPTVPFDIGQASFYDYTLKSGWSSVGHYVAASRDLPRYSCAKVTNVSNGKAVEVKITDYGPDESIHPGRIIDLSSTAFAAIAPLRLGLTVVRVEPCPEGTDL